jgi:hypothetical protein
MERRDYERRDDRNPFAIDVTGNQGMMDRFKNEKPDNHELDDMIQKFRNLFNTAAMIYKCLDKYDLCRYMKNKNSNISVFEVMNYIHCQHIIEKELKNGNRFDSKSSLEQNYFSSFKKENQNVSNIIDNYKTTASKGENDQMGYVLDSEKRRKILYSTTMGYNYLPVMCRDNDVMPCVRGELCRYAHTINEINFHPLKYKAIPCFKACDDAYCPYAKDGNELRVIYNGGDDDTIRLCQEIEIFLKENRIYKHYQELYPYPNEFDLNNFKIKECRGTCNQDYHLCLNAHQLNEQRRPLNIFFYSIQRCNEVLNSNDNFCRKYVSLLFILG